MFKLFVNNVQVDGLNSDNLVLNKQIFDLTDLDTRGIQISNNIILPRTGKNNIIFNILSEELIGQQYEIKIYEDSALVFIGDAVLKTITRNTIKLQLREEAKTFFENIKKPLSDLPLSSEDFIFNRASFDTLKTMSNTSLWQWAGIEFGNYELGIPPKMLKGIFANLDTSRPSYKVLDVLEQIIIQAGFIPNLSGIQELSGLVLTSNAEIFYFTDFEYRFQSIPITSGNRINYDDGTAIKSPVNFYTIINDGTGNNKLQNDILKSKYAISGIINLKTQVNLTVSIQSTSNPARNTKQYAIKDGIINIILDYLEPGQNIYITFDQDVTLNDLRVTGLIDESEYYLALGVPWPNGDTGLDGWQRILSDTVTRVPLLQDYLIKTQYNFPEWTQLKFIQELWKMFFIDIDVIESEVIVKFNRDINKISAPTADKITKISEVSRIDIFNQNNIFKYTNDAPLDENFASKQILIDNDSLSGDIKEIITLDTSATIEQEVLFPSFDFFIAGNVPIYFESTPKNTDSADRNSLTPRFLLYTDDNLQSAPLAELGNHTYFTNSSRTGIPIDDVALPFERLYNDYYSNIFDNIAINTSFKINKIMNIIEYNEILNKKIYYIEEFGRYFLVLNISKFNPSRETEIEVISF